MAHALLALRVAGDLHLHQFATQLGDLGVDPTPIGLDLRLTGTTATDAFAAGNPATGLAGEIATPTTQTLLHVVELRQLDLRLALTRLGMLGEDVEDQRGPVDDLDLKPVLEVPQLRGGEFTVADDGVGAGRVDDLGEPFNLAAADVRRRVWLLAALIDRLQDLGAGCLCQQCKLRQRVLGVGDRAAGGPHADEHDALEPELAVFDLGDVLEFGRQARHAPQGMPLGKLHGTLGLVECLLFGVDLVEVARDEGVRLGRVVVPLVGERKLSVQIEFGCVRHMPQE